MTERRLNFPALKEQDDKRIIENEKKPEIIPVNHQFKFRKVEADRRVENLSGGADAGKMVSRFKKNKADTAVQLSQRLYQINFLERKSKLLYVIYFSFKIVGKHGGRILSMDTQNVDACLSWPLHHTSR